MGSSKHGLKPNQISVKRKSTKVKGVSRLNHWSTISKMNIEDKKVNGYVTNITNIKGNTFWWYSKGRKTCLDTGLKCDPDGYNRWNTYENHLIRKKRFKNRVRKNTI